MIHLTFEWDEKKDASNKKKHGISFDESKTVFTDQFARLIADPDHSDDEDRFILLAPVSTPGCWSCAIAYG